MSSTGKNKKTVNKKLKNVVFTIIGYLGAIGIIFGPILIIYVIAWVVGLVVNNNANIPANAEIAKSYEQKRYEQECISVNTAVQEKPSTEFKIDKDAISTYCGCMGNHIFPNGAEKAVFPKNSDNEYDASGINKTCRIWAFTRKSDEPWSQKGWADSAHYGDLSYNFGDKEYFREYLTDYINMSIHDYWNEYHYNVSIDIPCVINDVYKGTPPYYIESIFMNGKIRTAIKACSNDSQIERFLDY